MTKRIIIPGPPGTGKTYRLINTYLKKEVNEHKTPVKKIGFFTFGLTSTITNSLLPFIVTIFTLPPYYL